MMEDLGSKVELNYYSILTHKLVWLFLLYLFIKQWSEHDEGSERSEHSSLEDFEETDNSLSVDLTDGNNIAVIHLVFYRRFRV